MFILLALLVLIPVIEIYFFIEIGGEIGAFNTVLLIFITAIAGAYFVRQQGINTLISLQQKLQERQQPGKEVFDGVCILIAGALLITPGFFTDGIGALLLIPAVRAFILGTIIDEALGLYTFGVMDRDRTKKAYTYSKDKAQKAATKIKDKVSKGKANGKVVDADFEDIPPK